MNDAVAALGDTFSAEHGIGRTLTAEMARYKPSVEIAMMQAVRRSLDPDGLFNPGRLLPPVPPFGRDPALNSIPPRPGE